MASRTQSQERSREKFGENKLPEQKREALLHTFLRQFGDPPIYILLAPGWSR